MSAFTQLVISRVAEMENAAARGYVPADNEIDIIVCLSLADAASDEALAAGRSDKEADEAWCLVYDSLNW